MYFGEFSKSIRSNTEILRQLTVAQNGVERLTEALTTVCGVSDGIALEMETVKQINEEREMRED